MGPGYGKASRKTKGWILAVGGSQSDAAADRRETKGRYSSPLNLTARGDVVPHRLGYRSRTRKPTCEHVFRRNTKLA